jgi:hypothetical protein
LAGDNTISNIDCDLILAIDCIKMWWVMIPIKDSYCDSKEAADNMLLPIIASNWKGAKLRGRLI